MTIEWVREIVKHSLHEYNGDRFDTTIDNLEIVRNDFRGIPCYYNPTPPHGHNIVVSFHTDDHGVTRKEDIIDINTNLIQSKWFFHKYGREFSYSRDRESDYDMEFNLKTKYNKSLSDVLSGIRNSKLIEIGI